MKRLIAVLAAVAASIGACGDGEGAGDEASPAMSAGEPTSTTDTTTDTTTEAPTTTATPTTTAVARPALDAGGLLAALKAEGLPVGEVLVYTAETDPNEQLGRPGGYTSKANFHDTRLESSENFDTLSGGSVEVFATEADAKLRYDYVDGITRGNAMLNEYHWQIGMTFLRASKSLTPDQAAEYEAAARKILS